MIDDMPEQTHENETGDVSGTDRYKNRYLEMGPGAVWDSLIPGESVKGIGLQRPNNNLIEFIADQNRRVASGIGCSYSSLTKRYDGTYSAQRQEMQEQKGSYDKLRNQFIGKFVQPIYERFLFWATESGALVVPRSVDPMSLARADFRGPAMPWIDPAKESTAAETDVRNGFKSRSMVIRERGNDPEIVDAQIQADLFATEDNSQQGDTPEESEYEDVKRQADAYGVGVRAGMVTPQQDDEQHFRNAAGLPPMGKDALEAWSDDGGVRRPITLQSGETYEAEQEALEATAKGGSDDDQDESEDEDDDT